MISIAIIGAGVSGLSSAYYLKQLIPDCNITLFDKNIRHGGHCDTIDIDLDVNETCKDMTFHRFVDLGVNDYNRNTYKEFKKLIDKFNVQTKPINDSICFYRGDDALSYTLDGKDDTLPKQDKILIDFEKFKDHAYDVLHNPKYEFATVSEFLEDIGVSEVFKWNNIYPRINAMFFTTEGEVWNMPIRMVMRYYYLQEGFGDLNNPTADRHYFVDGTQTWMHRLYFHLLDQEDVIFKKNVKIEKVLINENQVTISLDNHSDSLVFDKVIFAIPADEIKKIVVTPNQSSASRVMIPLNSITYSEAEVFAHTSNTVLPKDSKYWRCYNVRIYDYLHPDIYLHGSTFPYTITYLQNKHQNDDINPYYSQAEQDRTRNLYVTVNPPLKHREDVVKNIVKRIDGTEAYQSYRHNVMDMSAYLAKKSIDDNQGFMNAYYVGGFASHGVGLHEDLLCLAKSIAEKIASTSVENYIEQNACSDTPFPQEEEVKLEEVIDGETGHENGFSFNLKFD